MSYLDANLAALNNPALADAIRAATPGNLKRFDTPHGVGFEDDGRALCSRRNPKAEAEAIRFDVSKDAVCVVLGFGCGYHVAHIAAQMGRSGMVLVYEPDLSVLRAVFDAIDHTAWLTCCNVAILTDPTDTTSITQAMRGHDMLYALGVRVVKHPPSYYRIGESCGVFLATLQSVIEAAMTHVRTSIYLVPKIMDNLLSNAGRYAACDGSAKLKDAHKGRPGVVVSAGPSLTNALPDLKTAPPDVVIVCVQTALKTLLRNGIRPHYVTALDHADISARFYEGLTASDVEGITLFVDAKVNPVVPRSFPGRIVFNDDAILNKLLGPDLIGHRGTGGTKAGSTVAHLAYYLARFVGCDPVALVGQDLGFPDGMYYGDGAAIHDTWAGELNEFNTLEMMELERVKRIGSLRTTPGYDGEPVLTDEQMHTYRLQFERDFAEDVAAGMRVVDCSGGAAKRGAVRGTLVEVLGT